MIFDVMLGGSVPLPETVPLRLSDAVVPDSSNAISDVAMSEGSGLLPVINAMHGNEAIIPESSNAMSDIVMPTVVPARTEPPGKNTTTGNLMLAIVVPVRSKPPAELVAIGNNVIIADDVVMKGVGEVVEVSPEREAEVTGYPVDA